MTLIPSHLIDLSIKDFSKSLKKSDFQENDLSFEMGKQFYVLCHNTLIMLIVIG
jgi:hypothetical protein